MPKTTYKISDLLLSVNTMLKNKNISEEEKKGMTMVLTNVLSDTGTYGGYYYNEVDEDYQPKEQEEFNRTYLPHNSIRKQYQEIMLAQHRTQRNTK